MNEIKNKIHQSHQQNIDDEKKREAKKNHPFRKFCHEYAASDCIACTCI